MSNEVVPPLKPLIDFHTPRFQPWVDHFQKTKKLHPSILISGLQGCGKRTATKHFIQLLFCDQSIFAGQNDDSGSLFGDSPRQTEPCGVCDSCIRAKNEHWLDLHWLEPDGDEDKIGSHKVDTFRELASKVGMGPGHEPYRVAVIADAELMNSASSNSILKLIEEPPPNWIFILTTTDSSRILPTLLSRCIELKLKPIPVDILMECLQSILGNTVPNNKMRIAAMAAQGSLARAQTLLKAETWQLRDEILDLFQNPSRSYLKLVDHLAASQKQLSLGLDLLESLFMDFLKHEIKGRSYDWVHADQQEPLTQWVEAKNRTRHIRWDQLLSELIEIRRFAGTSANAKLLAQKTLIPLLDSIFS